jgi:WD40 repeat protein
MELIGEIPLPESLSTCLSFSTDGSCLVSGVCPAGEKPFNETLRIWEMPTRRERKPIAAGPAIPAFVGISANKEVAGAIDTNRARTLWDLNARRIVRQSTGQLAGPLVFHPSEPSWAFTEDGQTQHVRDWTITVQEYESAKIVNRFPVASPVAALCFGDGGRKLVAGCIDGTVVVSDLALGTSEQLPRRHHHGIRTVAWALGEKLLASGGWGWVSGTSETEIVLWKGEPLEAHRLKCRHTRIESAAFTRDGRLLVIVGGMTTGEISIWDPTTGLELCTRTGSRPYVAVACSPTADVIATAGQVGRIELWEYRAP